MNTLLALCTKFKTWSKAKVNKQPLSRENAYVLSSVGKKSGTYPDITKMYQEFVLKEIESSAKLRDTYLLIEHPDYITPKDKENLLVFLAELGYSICFSNDDIVLISWKYSSDDFKVK